VSATFLEICKSINNAIWKNCKDSKVSTIKINLATCDILDDLQVPENISTSDVRQMLKLFKLDTNTLESQLTFDIYKKLMSKTNETTLTKIAAANFVANVTTFYIPDQYKFFSLGSISSCDLIQTNNDIVKTNSSQNISHIDNEAKHPAHVDAKFEMNDKFPPQLNTFDLRNDNGDDIEAYNWQIRSELWVAIGLTISTLGILLCIAILTFILARICMEDVLEGNPIGSILLLLALIAQFASFFPFTIEYRGYKTDHFNTSTAIEIFNSMCTIRIFVVSVCYCLTFSLLLSRAIMLASIGSEGGFLSHVNGYIQSVICIFSFLVQLGLSTQLLIMMHANQKHVTCEHVFYGNWFWAILGYDMMLLIMLVGLSPFIFRSQRNYQEGILIVITAVLCLICWMIWIPLSTISNNFREIAVPLGVQATGWIVLASLMVPRCFLIVRSIARSDFTQALPSLTSLAFAQANQFNSEPVSKTSF
jgi:bride of sevenless protein